MTAQIDEQEPDVSHDGRYIAFRVSGVGDDRNSDGDIWIMQADGQDLQRLGIRGRSPVWSPDDTTLAFMSERSGNWDIYTYNLSSGQERQITQCTVNCRWPAWSPDGGAVLYHTTTGRNSVSADALWYAPVTGGNPIPITSGFGSGRGSWSSEALIVFNSDNGVEYARVDGGSRTVLIAGGENWAPIWSR